MSPNFVVFDKHVGRYVSSIDTFDGSTEHTADVRQARIFRGDSWVEFWGWRERYRIDLTPNA